MSFLQWGPEMPPAQGSGLKPAGTRVPSHARNVWTHGSTLWIRVSCCNRYITQQSIMTPSESGERRVKWHRHFVDRISDGSEASSILGVCTIYDCNLCMLEVGQVNM